MILQQPKVAMMQPSFMPWQGFFELIYLSDIFIFLDDFQLSIQSRQTRSQLFTSKNQVNYYSVPIQKELSFKKKLLEALIVENDFWKNKVIKRLQNNYAKAPFFKPVQNLIEDWIYRKHVNLAELNISLILSICNYMGIQRNFMYSSQMSKFNSIRSKRVLDILQNVHAHTYLSAFGSFTYMLEDGVFPRPEMQVFFQNFVAKPYKQVTSEVFIPNLSIVDTLYNVGPQETLCLLSQGTKKWLTWEERNEQ